MKSFIYAWSQNQSDFGKWDWWYVMSAILSHFVLLLLIAIWALSDDLIIAYVLSYGFALPPLYFYPRPFICLSICLFCEFPPKMWEAGFFLLEYAIACPDEFMGSTVLELGAGGVRWVGEGHV
jgi:hypothetical protein